MGSIGNTVTKGCACVRGMSALGLTWSGGAGAGEEGGGRRSQRFGESFGGTLVGIHEGWRAGEVTIWVRRGGGVGGVGGGMDWNLERTRFLLLVFRRTWAISKRCGRGFTPCVWAGRDYAPRGKRWRKEVETLCFSLVVRSPLVKEMT